MTDGDWRCQECGVGDMNLPCFENRPPDAFGDVSRYSTQQVTLEDQRAVSDALGSSHLTQGPAVEKFERELAEYVGAKYAVAVSSGTAALHLAYLAALAQCVVTSPLSFVATANAALLAGAAVGFVDVDRDTGNLAAHPESCPPIGTVVVPVHFAGRPAPIPRLSGFGGRVPVVEDACHALGAIDYDGCSRVGSCAHSLATCFSFHPVKPITTGEGGAVTTNSEVIAARLRLLRSHGRDADGMMVELGYNYRMSEMQAALGSSQLVRCDHGRQTRARLAEVLSERIHSAGIRDIKLFGQDGRGAWHLFAVRLPAARRDAVKLYMRARGIGVQVHYWPPIHLQPFYKERYHYRIGDFPEAEAWAAEELSLPLHAGMSAFDVDRVVDVLKEAVRS